MGSKQSNSSYRKLNLVKLMMSDRLLEEVEPSDSAFTFGELSWSLMHFACWKNDFRLIQKLHSLGFDLNVQDIHGNTPLHLSCMLEEPLLSRKLEELGANPSIENNQGRTPRTFDYFSSVASTEVNREGSRKHTLENLSQSNESQKASQIFPEEEVASEPTVNRPKHSKVPPYN